MALCLSLKEGDGRYTLQLRRNRRGATPGASYSPRPSPESGFGSGLEGPERHAENALCRGPELEQPERRILRARHRDTCHVRRTGEPQNATAGRPAIAAGLQQLNRTLTLKRTKICSPGQTGRDLPEARAARARLRAKTIDNRSEKTTKKEKIRVKGNLVQAPA